MEGVKKTFYEVIGCLAEASIDYAVCGGWAVAIHGCPRATKDVDLVVRPEDIDRIKELLRPIGFTLSAGVIPFDRGTEKERRVHRITRVDDEIVALDLLEVGPALEGAWKRRAEYQIGEHRVWAIDIDGLIEMKKDAGRPQDLSDIERLEQIRDDTGR